MALWMLPDIGNNAMNAPRCWQLRDYACSHAGTSANTLAALQIEWGNSAQPLKKPTKMTSIPKAGWISFPRWELVSEWPTDVWGDAESLKGSRRMGDWQIFLKTSAPLSLIKTYRIHLGYLSTDNEKIIGWNYWKVCSLHKTIILLKNAYT